ncbi:MAG: RagB/SusD family nutrient uptake outer membrane protein [Bacteroidales bacterium]|jgi:hypothetical protein|nr:RagB/SusD family nutrient uptake outer membrane protein [Bacteroidales bacterium]
MKFNRISILLCGILAATSCLDHTPLDTIPADGVINSLKAAQVALVGVYDAAQTFESRAVVTLNYAADNVVLFSSQAVVIPQFKAAGTAGWDPTSGGGFADYYNGINQANTVIKYLPAVSGDTVLKDNLLAQAYFLRALAYFDLARTYGGVQLILEPSESPDNGEGVKKSSYEDVLKQVKADLSQAEALFDESFSSAAKASLWAAYALKARVCLYLEEWEEAADYAGRVIGSGRFALTPEVSGFFENALSGESVFELVFSSADRLPFFTYYLPSDKGGRLDYIPEPEFVNELLDPAKGGKRAQLIYDKGDGVYAIAEYAKQDGSSSIPVLRLAEQYLIRAEALLHKAVPDAAGACEDLNVIRRRAGLDELDLSDPAALLLQVETERRYELAFDAHRFNDIVRTGRAAEVFGAHDSAFTNPDYWVLPIPNNADLADEDLDQNPGY